ncbi:Crooked neck-like protein 1 [Chytridiales sp. JEL 0842]|nr:Crooked neck-like protein 1 [Chytridiales sp. JEL 0842]
MDSKGRPSKVKNKNPAPVQITAEQILREASERQEAPYSVPKQKIADFEELQEYRQKKRKGFEDRIRKDRTHVGTWLRYAAWEESQFEYDRARSVYERALDIEHKNHPLWLKYVEMELRHKNINAARNIFDRVVAILPRVDVFWYKYTYTEEMLDNPAGARQVFERWMDWEPPVEAWSAYIKFEKRYKENEKARVIYQRMISVHPQAKNWLKWAKFEESLGFIDHSREIYEKCIETLGDEYVDQNVYVSFAKFECRQKEIERARAIYQYALTKLPKTAAQNLRNVYTQFEKQYGGKEIIEDVIVTKRRVKYEEEVTANPTDYDVWFDYSRLEESTGDYDRIRDIYERAIAQMPPVQEKRLWRRYIYLWLFYAVWEERVPKDFERAKEIYTKCLQLIPHKQFTFAKIWVNYAKFLIRRDNFDAFRKTLGMAIGMCPKEKLFKAYIDLEIQLREFDRVRKLYEKYLEWNPANGPAWIKYAELERTLGDLDRARGIYEIAVAQPVLDMPEVVWKAFIDFETGEEEWDKARALYERLLDKTDHVKVWIAFANFELINLNNSPDLSGRIPVARSIFEKAYNTLRKSQIKDERVVLLESWLDFEKTVVASNASDKTFLEKVQSKMPKAVKKRRRIQNEDGTEGEGWEEYYDYLFPDDDTERPNLKLFQMAHAWKEKLKMGAISSDEDDDAEDEEDEEEEEKEGKGEEEEEEQGEGERKRKRDADDDE